MAGAGIEVATAYVSIVPTAKGIQGTLSRQITPAAANVGKTAGKQAGSNFVDGVKGNLKKIAGLFGIALGAKAIYNFFKAGVQGANAYRKTAALTAQAIKSTGGAAGITAKQVATLSGKIAQSAGTTRGWVQQAANMLLRFTSIRNVGVDKIFDKATAAVVDLAKATGRDATGAARMLGRALESPASGMTALTRAGVVFTDEQKKRIKGFVEEGDKLAAQKEILKGVQERYGGAAAAIATPMDRLRSAFAVFRSGVGRMLLPALDSIATSVTANVIPALGRVAESVRNSWKFISPGIDQIKEGFVSLGQAIANLWMIAAPTLELVGAAFVGAFRGVAPILDTVMKGFKAVTDFMRGNTAIFTAVVTAVLAVWAAFEGYHIVVIAIENVKSAFETLVLQAMYAKESIISMSTVAKIATGVLAAGVGIAVFFWMKHREKVAENKAEIERLTEAVKRDSGAIKENVREQVADELQKQKVFDAANKLGLSLDTVTKAAMGNSDAIAAVNAAHERWSETQKAGAEFLYENGTAIKNTDEQAKSLAFDLRGQTSDWAKLMPAISGTNDKLNTAVSRYQNIKSATEGTGSGLSDTTAAMEAQTKAAEDLKKALDDLMGNAISVREAEIAVKEGISGLNEQIKTNGKTLDLQTTKGRANQSWLIDQIQNIKALTDAQIDSGMSADQAASNYEHNVNVLRQQMIAAGFSKQSVDALIRSLNATPKEVRSELTVADAAAKMELTAYQRMLDRAKNPISTDVHLNTATARADLNAFLSRLPSKLQSMFGVGGPGNWAQHGGYIQSGVWNVVGEVGPELVSPTGMVYPTNRSIQKLWRSGASGGAAGPMRIVGGQLSITPDSQGHLAAWVRDLVIEESQFAASTARLGG